MDKEVLSVYLAFGIVLVLALTGVYFLGSHFTGYAVYETGGQTAFDEGTYSNTEWNGSDVVLSSGQTSGIYTSKVFDAGAESTWNNLSWIEILPTVETLFAVDGVADIWQSSDEAASWSLAKDDYTGADGNGATYMISNSSGSLFVLFNQDVWQSVDSGVTWTKVNDDFNGAPSNSGLVFAVDSNDYLYVVDGGDRVSKSIDSGISFSSVNEGFGEGPNAGGIAIDLDDYIYIIDNSANVYKSVDSGVSWIKINDDYNGGVGNDISDMNVNSSGDLFALHNQDVWQSVDSGVTWTLVNDDYNGGSDSNAGQVIYIDSNDYIYIVDGSEDVYKSTDSGTSFSLVASDFNGANGNIFGLTSITQETDLLFSTRSCDDDACVGESWVDVTGDSPQDLSLGENIYFQYRVDFTTLDSSVSPALQNVSIDYTVLNSAPTVSIVLPQDGTTYGYDVDLDLNFSVGDADDNLDSCWYDLDSGANVTLIDCQNVTFDAAEGLHNLIVYVNDSQNEVASDSVSFSVQVGAPTIVLDSPVDVYLNSQSVTFRYTPTDIDLDYCELWGNFTGDFVLSETESSPLNGGENTFDLDLGDGEYLWNVRCVDDVVNSAFNGNKTFYVDTVVPGLSLTEPAGEKTSRSEVPLMFVVEDLSPVTCKYNVTRGETLEITDTLVNCNESFSFDVSVDADFVLNFYVNDSAGNLNSSSIEFSVDTSTPQNPPNGGGGGGSSDSSAEEIDFSGNLEVGSLSDSIVIPGESKKMVLYVKNSGLSFLNDCKLGGDGVYGSWVSSSENVKLGGGESYEFVFDLEVPKDLGAGSYDVGVKISCEDGGALTSFNVEVIEEKLGFDLIEAKRGNDVIEVSYWLEESSGIDQTVDVQFLLFGEGGEKVAEMAGQEFISANAREIFQVSIPIDKDVEGELELLVNLNSESYSTFVKERVILTAPVGFAVLSMENLSTNVISGVVIVAFLIFAFFMVARIRRLSKKHKGHKRKRK